MTIPPFDSIRNTLPPHLGDPRNPADLSPYPCTVQELCVRFATSAKRKTILEGFLDLRAELLTLGVRGFQWLDGSLLEDIETLESRDPENIDVVTFVASPDDSAKLFAAIKPKPELLSRHHVKGTFLVDHFWVPLGCPPRELVYHARYWYGLFSHRRGGVWKGMLVVELASPADDDAARKGLGGKP
ncbi:MAG: hypothetical protein NTY19_05650 [Planctomycetota bacterium]|nr:hypothetical protein [Planctomycetota bacterium]